jgi:hypothetical protein
MSWTDKAAIKTILQLRDDFKIEDFVETGTFKGVNAKLHSNYFKNVITCEYNEEYFYELESKRELPNNIQVHLSDSPSFLYMYRWHYLLDSTLPPPLFYLDAHFYLPEMKNESNEKKFVILRELKALSDFENCIIIIHDFDCSELGHITYDKISLNFDLVKDYLNKVNPNFKYYINCREYCDIITPEEVIEGKIKGVEATEDVLDNLKYVWSSPEKTYRGILYCIPKELDLSKYALKELK